MSRSSAARPPRAPTSHLECIPRARSSPAAPPQLAFLALAALLAVAACDGPVDPRIQDPDPVIQDFEITATTDLIDVGESLALTTSAPSGVSLEWSSTNPAVAEVTGGVVVGKSVGTTTIRATGPALEGSFELQVREPLHELRVEPSRLRLLPGREAQLFVIQRDAAGAPQQRQVSFSSSHGNVQVADSGVVTAAALGAATVTVRVGVRLVEVPVEVVTGDSHTVTVVTGIAATDLNNRGWVVGWREGQAVLWREGEVLEIAVPGAASSRAEAVNEMGVVIGSGMTGGDAPLLWTWSEGVTTLITIPAPPDGRAALNIVGLDISAVGEIAGTLFAGAGAEGQPAEVLPFRISGGSWSWLPPSVNVSGISINRHGAIAYGHVIWEGGTLRQLPLPHPGATSWSVQSLNDHGVYVGEFWHQSESGLWTYGGFRGQGEVFEAFFGAAVDVNQYGDIVGWSYPGVMCSATCTGFLRWEFLSRALQGPGWRTTAAHRINDLGQVLASGYVQGEPSGTLLLEPSS